MDNMYYENENINFINTLVKDEDIYTKMITNLECANLNKLIYKNILNYKKFKIQE